jgi:hypothetical protein
VAFETLADIRNVDLISVGMFVFFNNEQFSKIADAMLNKNPQRQLALQNLPNEVEGAGDGMILSGCNLQLASCE